MSTNNIEITVGQRWRHKTSDKVIEILPNRKCLRLQSREVVTYDEEAIYSKFILDPNYIIDLLLEKYK